MKPHSRSRIFVLAVAVLAVGMATATSSGQQDFRPLSPTGGFAGQELRNIYASDIGQGFSVQTLNNLALQNSRAQVGNYGQMSAPRSVGAGSGRGGFGSQPSYNPGKPFSGYSPSPTVSPYLNLFRDDLDGSSDFNYNTLVRPMLQQQQVNEQVQRQAMETARRLQSMSGQSDFNPEGAKDLYPTGHPTTYRYFGHFHPRAAYRPSR